MSESLIGKLGYLAIIGLVIQGREKWLVRPDLT